MLEMVGCTWLMLKLVGLCNAKPGEAEIDVDLESIRFCFLRLYAQGHHPLDKKN
jgi:hypothetical protein